QLALRSLERIDDRQRQVVIRREHIPPEPPVQADEQHAGRSSLRELDRPAHQRFSLSRIRPALHHVGNSGKATEHKAYVEVRTFRNRRFANGGDALVSPTKAAPPTDSTSRVAGSRTLHHPQRRDAGEAIRAWLS